MAVTGANRVAINTASVDPAPPSPLDSVVHANDNRAIGHEPFDDDAKQSPGNGTGAPAGAAQDLVVGCEVDGLGPAGHTQARSNSALARGQQAAHHENKHMLPTGCSKAGTPRLQPLAQDLGNGIADNGLVLVQHPILRILTEARCNAWAVAMR